MIDADKNEKFPIWIDFSIYTPEESLGWINGIILYRQISEGDYISLDISMSQSLLDDESKIVPISLMVIHKSCRINSDYVAALTLADLNLVDRVSALQIVDTICEQYGLHFHE